MKHRFSTWLLAASQIALIVPFQASAAGSTPQQVLDIALSSYGSRSPLASNATFNFNVSERDYKTRAIKQTGQGNFFMRERHLPKVNGMENAEGTLRIDNLAFGEGSSKTNVVSPISVEWKVTDKTLYVRITQAPDSLLSGLSNGGDYSKLLNQWISVYDSSDASKSSIQVEEATLQKMIGGSSFWKDAGKRPLLTVVRVEKREKRADGHEILRMKVKINPALVNLWYASQLRQIKYNDPSRRTRINSLNKQMASIRQALTRLSMVAVVDATAGTLERFEAGWKQVDPKKSCAWNTKLHRSVCKTTGTQTITAALGVSFLPDSGAPIEVPYGSLTMEELLKNIEPPKPEPLPAPMPPAATTTTN